MEGERVQEEGAQRRHNRSTVSPAAGGRGKAQVASGTTFKSSVISSRDGGVIDPAYLPLRDDLLSPPSLEKCRDPPLCHPMQASQPIGEPPTPHRSPGSHPNVRPAQRRRDPSIRMRPWSPILRRDRGPGDSKRPKRVRG